MPSSPPSPAPTKPVVLVTGANGGLARACRDRLMDSHVAVGLVRPGTGASASRWTRLSDDPAELLATTPRVDAVLHLAARIPATGEHPADLLAANVDLVSALVQALPAARHVLASSVSVYGLPGGTALRIDTPAAPVSPYGWSKLAAECLVRQCRRHAVIRFSSLIGAGGRPGTFVPHIVAAARGGSITLHGDGSRQQNYVDLDDAAAMCLRALELDANFVALGVAERSHSNAEVAAMLARLTGACVRHAGTDDSASWVYDRRGSVDLGPCRIPLETTLRNMLSP